MNDINTVCIWLIKKLCVDTNADEAKITQENFHDKKTGKVYGTYEIIVRKVEADLKHSEEEYGNRK